MTWSKILPARLASCAEGLFRGGRWGRNAGLTRDAAVRGGGGCAAENGGDRWDPTLCHRHSDKILRLLP